MKNADKPVYPVPERDYNKFSEHAAPWCGLTKREAFAMAAMQGILANRDPLNNYEMAKEAVNIANALLSELEKEKE